MAKGKLMLVAKGKKQRSRILRVSNLIRHRRAGFNADFDRIVYRYKQYCDSTSLNQKTITTAALTENGYSWQFQLNMIPQFATFTSLYDVYRIDMVEFTVVPRASINIASGALAGTNQGINTTLYLARFIMTVDTDDAVVPTTYNQIREYGQAKEYYVVQPKPIKIYFKPAVAQLLYNGITPASTEKFSPWIDCANSAVPHYGVKIVMPQTQADNYITCDITARYLLSFKQVR